MKRSGMARVGLMIVLCFAILIGVLPVSAAAEDWIEREPVTGADYSFAVMGDIQFVTYSDHLLGTNYLEDMVTWLLDNREERNIQYLFELGDTVQTLASAPASQNPAVNNPGEWETASAQFCRLDGKLPYSIVRGNHDDEAGYHTFICSREYRKQMDEFFFQPIKDATLGNSMSNSYRTIEIGNHKYLMLALDYNVRPETMAWANTVISEHRDHKVIVSMHAYLEKDGSFYRGEVSSANVDNSATEKIAFDAEYLWNHLFSRHENLFMILSGHLDVEDPVIHTRKGTAGNEVIELLVDPQGYESKDTCGFLMMLNFTDGGRKIEIEYFSPSRGMSFREKNQLTLTLAEGSLPTYVPPAPEVETESVLESVDTTELFTEELESSDEEGEEYGTGVVIGAAVGGVAVLFVVGAFLLIRKNKRRKE